MPDLTRDVLIGEAEDAIDALPTHGPAQEVERSVAIAAAVDAALRLVADDLDRKADSDHDMNCSCEKCIEQTGVLIAAERLRSLLPSTEGDQP